MRKFIASAVLVSTLIGTSACTTVPDPAEVCSAEWIAPRADRAMKDFKRDTRSIFKKLKKTGNKLESGGNIGPLQMFSLMNSLSSLGKKLENGRAMRDMRTLANTCDDPKLIKTAMTDFMRDQGIDEKFIRFLNNFDAYTTLLETGEKPNIEL